MWVKQCHKPPIWEWFIKPIYGDGGSFIIVLSFYPHLSSVQNPCIIPLYLLVYRGDFGGAPDGVAGGDAVSVLLHGSDPEDYREGADGVAAIGSASPDGGNGGKGRHWLSSPAARGNQRKSGPCGPLDAGEDCGEQGCWATKRKARNPDRLR